MEKRTAAGFEGGSKNDDVNIDGVSQGGKPQYVIDQENGISRLQPKVFEPISTRWKPLRPAEVGDSRTDAGCSQGCVVPVKPLAELVCVTYNVWFDKRYQHARALALFEILRASGAHVISLQEVTPDFLGWLRDQDFVRQNYILSDSIGTTLKGSKLVYGVVQLVRRDQRIRVESMTLHAMPTNMNRSALVTTLMIAVAREIPSTGQNNNEMANQEGADAEADVAGAYCPAVAWHRVAVSTAHLESLENTPYREAQLKIIDRATRDAGAGQGPVLSHVTALRPFDGSNASAVQYDCLIMGDCNFDDGSSEEEVLCRSQGDWEDLHHHDLYGHKKLEGIGSKTGVTMPCDDVTGHGTRIDRVFGILNYLEPVAMSLLGTDPIDTAPTTEDAAEEPTKEGERRVRFILPTDDRKDVIRPSDHYGVMVRFTVRDSRSPSAIENRKRVADAQKPTDPGILCTTSDHERVENARKSADPGDERVRIVAGPDADLEASRSSSRGVTNAASGTCQLSSTMCVRMNVSASGSSTSYFMITKPKTSEVSMESAATAAAPAPALNLNPSALSAAAFHDTKAYDEEEEDYGSEFDAFPDFGIQGADSAQPPPCAITIDTNTTDTIGTTGKNTTWSIPSRRVSPLWICEEDPWDVDEELEARLEEARTRARAMDRTHGPRKPATFYTPIQTKQPRIPPPTSTPGCEAPPPAVLTDPRDLDAVAVGEMPTAAVASAAVVSTAISPGHPGVRGANLNLEQRWVRHVRAADLVPRR